MSGSKTSLKSLAGSGTILAGAMFLANGGNYLLNLLFGRWLTQAEFADANLMVTLMLLVTAVAVSLQLVAAKFASQHEASGTPERAIILAHSLQKWALASGLFLAALFVFFAPFWSSFFNTESSWPFIILGIGMPFYLIQAVGRGVLQGRLSFVRLAATFVIEMFVRLLVGIVLVAAGYGVNGATVALSISFAATWFVVHLFTRSYGKSQGTLSAVETSALKSYIAPVAVLLLGQIVINNSDVLVVKRYFLPDDAGLYAAIALIGRAVFFLSWSAVTALFPAASQRKEAGESSSVILRFGLLIVFGMCASMVLAAYFGGDIFLTSVFGEGYAGIDGLLTKYAFATSLFALANMVVSHQLSLGRYRESFLLLGGAVLQLGFLLWSHADMAEVIDVQIFVMSILLISVLWSSRSEILGRKEKVEKKPANFFSTAAEKLTTNGSSEMEPIKKFEGPTMSMEQYRTWSAEKISGRPRLSLIIPTFNEEWRILPTIGAIASYVSAQGYTWELIVSDDGSADDTVRLVRELGLANVKVLADSPNTGKGGAVRRGVACAEGELIAFVDADQSTPIEQLPRFITEISTATVDIAIGSRNTKDSAVANKSLPRRLLSQGLQAFVKLIFRLPYRDTQCGFKLFTAESAKQLFGASKIDGFSFDLELLYIAKQMDMTVSEVPVRWHDAPGSTVSGGRDAIKFILDMPKILLSKFRGEYKLDPKPVSAQEDRTEKDKAVKNKAEGPAEKAEIHSAGGIK